jgi:hypothetical protein
MERPKVRAALLTAVKGPVDTDGPSGMRDRLHSFLRYALALPALMVCRIVGSPKLPWLL